MEATEKSPGDLARERAAKPGYEFLTNYSKETPPGKDHWLKGLKFTDPSVEDLIMEEPAFNDEGEQINYMRAAYVRRKPQDK